MSVEASVAVDNGSFILNRVAYRFIPFLMLYRASHGVQTGDGRVQNLATIARSKPVAESRQRYKIQRRNRSCRRNQIRRLIHAVTDFSA
jgi:hypothetical protein